MEMTAVYVEQVIIGSLVLIAASLLVTGALPPVDNLKESVLWIGAAYVIGILYDKCADTMLERVDRWNRISFAVDVGKLGDGDAVRDDLFPEYGKRHLLKSDMLAYLL